MADLPTHIILSIVTPEKKVIENVHVSEVFVPAFRGEINILPGHSPLMTTLSSGVLKYREVGKTELEHVAISWGYCQVAPFGVQVLAETAEPKAEIDLQSAENE